MELTLEQSDVVVLFTDGITEARDNDDCMFSVDTLIAILAEVGGCTTEEIKNRILDELKDYHTHDDVTMIILKKL